MAEFDAVAVIGLLIGFGWYLMYLSEQRAKRPAKDTVEDVLEKAVLIDDFEEYEFEEEE